MTNQQHHVHGIHAVQTLMKTGPQRIHEILITKSSNARLEKIRSQARKQDIPVKTVDREYLDSLTGEKHQGVCALCSAGESHDEKWLVEMCETTSSPLLLILDSITDPHNLGACLRTADATGVNAVIIPKDKSCGINATVTKVASGAAETVPVIAVTNLARCMEKLQQAGVWISGTCDQADKSVFDIDLTGPTAIVLGSEDKGLRRLTREHCDQLVNIPMLGEVSSLNVSVATGVCLYAAVQQRH